MADRSASGQRYRAKRFGNAAKPAQAAPEYWEPGSVEYHTSKLDGEGQWRNIVLGHSTMYGERWRTLQPNLTERRSHNGRVTTVNQS